VHRRRGTPPGACGVIACGLPLRASKRQRSGVVIASRSVRARGQMKCLVLHSASSPIAPPIRPLAVAATGDGWRVAGIGPPGVGMRDVPGMRLGCGPRRSEAAARAMGRVERRGVVEGARPPIAGRRKARGSHAFSAKAVYKAVYRSMARSPAIVATRLAPDSVDAFFGNDRNHHQSCPRIGPPPAE